jgi:hypothetical protein
VKRRNRTRQRRFGLRNRQALGSSFSRAQRKRKSWSFERLEDRLVFSVDPVDLQTVSFSNDTAAGAALTLADELHWAQLMAANGSTASGDSAGASTTPNLTFLSLPNDPLFPDQWHLLNTGQEVGNPDFGHIFGVAGQDIHVVPVWNMIRPDGGVGYTGAGVVVAVIDSGVEVGHPDLAENISPDLKYDAVSQSNNVLPDPTDPLAGHGTSVSGLIGAVWNNLGPQELDNNGDPLFDVNGNPVYSGGGVGVAPNVTLVPIKVGTAFGIGEDAIARGLQYALQHGVDITNNSYGPSSGRTLTPFTFFFPGTNPLFQDPAIPKVLRDAAQFGRNGLGMISVFSSGNDGGPDVEGGNWGSASYNEFINSRYVIGVTGVYHDGTYNHADGSFTSYPESGPNVLVAAPTGSNVAQDIASDTGQGSGLWTTDLTGNAGFNAAALPNGFDQDRDFSADPDYTARFNGTSASAPVATGVIALMLDANPNLTYRDVQEILVRSSRTNAWYESPNNPIRRAGAQNSVASGTGDATVDGTSSVDTSIPIETWAAMHPTNSAATGSTSADEPIAPGQADAVPPNSFDFGDAPEVAQQVPGQIPFNYPTTLVNNGARHRIDNNTLTLGTRRDVEADGQPTVLADGDDGNQSADASLVDMGDDEDGVAIPILFRGQTATITVHASWSTADPNVDVGVLNAWFDFDGDGQWQDNPVEHAIINRVLLNGQDTQITVTVPASASLAPANRPSFARFRLTSDNFLRSLDPINLTRHMLPTGTAADGEVEDYTVSIRQPTTTGTGNASVYQNTTWQTNQMGPFRDLHDFGGLRDPIADPSVTGHGVTATTSGTASPASGNDLGRREGFYELMPGLYANSAGYTVSQGFGAFGDQVGYAHGVVDADLAVKLALQWNTLGQNIAPQTEKTYTTFLTQGVQLPAAEVPVPGAILIPGGIGGSAGYSGHLIDPATPYTRGDSYVDFVVPPNQQINVETVEVKVTVTGDPSKFDFLRLMLTSPDGTQSELMHSFQDPALEPYTLQVLSHPVTNDDPAGDLAGGTFTWVFTSNRNWGETTNTAVILNPITGEPVPGPGTSAIVDATGQPIDGAGVPIFRNWELHIENWGGAPVSVGPIEMVWHGKPVAAPSQYLTFDPAFPNAPGLYQNLQQGQNAWDQRWLVNGTNTSVWQVPMAQRIQGSVGIDQNGDNQFNYDRYVQTINPRRLNNGAYDASNPNADDILRSPDYTDVNGNGVFDAGTDIPHQEDFASNIVVSLFRVNKVTGLVDSTPTAYFVTGADGNYYFDVDPTYEWVIRITDPQGRDKLDDVATAANHLKHYETEWRITPDWFFAPDRDNSIFSGNNATTIYENGQQFKPGEIFFGSNDANGDGVSTLAPIPFQFVIGQDANGQNILQDPIPMEVKNLNFLLKATPTTQQFTVNGVVFADLNGNNVFDGNDALMPNTTVYWDANRNGVYESGELTAITNSQGAYSLAIPSTTPGTFSIGVRLPGADWQFKSPATGVADVFLPSDPPQVQNFALTAPSDAFPSNPPSGAIARILGVVWDDLDKDGIRDPNEPGAAGVTVFIDTNTNGILDGGEQSAVTASNGSFVLDNVTPGNNLRIDVSIPNENTANAPYTLTSPQLGYRVVSIGVGGTVTNQLFGVSNRADHDWGDLPDSYNTTAGNFGPSHLIEPGFRLGNTISGEVNGQVDAAANADTFDDGVTVVSGNGKIFVGANTIRVTAFGVGGFLTGWMDFNNDGHFDESERIQWILNGNNLGGEAAINPGTYDFQVNVPSSIIGATRIAARFRWGEAGLSFKDVDHAAQIGEVEDYFFGINNLVGDYNRNGVVDAADFVLWKKQFGQSVPPFSGADGNGNGVIDQGDYDVWKANFGNSLPPGSGSIIAGGGMSESNSNSSQASAASLESNAGSGLGGQSTGAASPPVALPPDTASTDTSSDSSLTSQSLVAAFGMDVSHATTAGSTSSQIVQSAGASDSDQADLLLLDEAWAEADSASYTHADDSLYGDQPTESVSANDLALAAVLNEEDNWWDGV